MTQSIPAAVVRQLRGALFGQLGSVAEDLAALNNEPGREVRGEWSEHIERFDRTRALLDRIGWSEQAAEGPTEIDLDRHRRAIVDSLRSDLEVARSLVDEEGDAAEGQRWRARAEAQRIEAFAEAAGLDLAADPEQVVTVPQDFLPTLREAVLLELQEAAILMEAVAFDPDSRRDTLERFDAIRAVLAAIEGAVAEIDVGAHRGVLQDALAERLRAERLAVTDGREGAEKGYRDAELQVQEASRNALAIERFMGTAGLETPAAGESQ